MLGRSSCHDRVSEFALDRGPTCLTQPPALRFVRQQF
jgi:hypothetical protein